MNVRSITSKTLLASALAITSLRGQDIITQNVPPPIVTPYGAWTVCDTFNPIPEWAQAVCATLSPDAPKPSMLSVWAHSPRTVAFAYQIQYTDATGKLQTSQGAFLRQDIGGTTETIFLPIPGLNGMEPVSSLIVRDLTTLEEIRPAE